MQRTRRPKYDGNPFVPLTSAPRTDVNVYIGGVGPEADALRRGIPLACERAIAGGHRCITLAVPARGNLQGMVEDALGEPAVAALLRTRRLDLGDFTIDLATARRPPRHVGPILAVFTASDQTMALLSDRHATDLIVVPWCDEDLVALRAAVPDAKSF